MTFSVTIEPKGLTFTCAEEQSIAEAAQESGVRFPISCRNGVCHICRAKLELGVVSTPTGLVAQQSQDGTPNDVFVCHAKPRSDLILRMDGVYGPKELPMKNIICQIQSVSVLQGDVYQVILELPAGKPVAFFAGQYLALDLPQRDEDAYFSIASAPGLREIELHIQADPHLEKALEIVKFLQDNKSVSVKLPFGKACLDRVPSSAVLLLAAGTGFAQMKSIIEYLLANGFQQELSLYWTARKQSDLYALESVQNLAETHENFRFECVVTETLDPTCTEHHSLLADAILSSHDDLSNSLVFAAGSPKLVYTSLDALEQAGLSQEHFYSDVLEYVSRDQI
ncbi:hypothetical protein A3742_10325 [Oleiphilus sp. HI0071]|uniref:2Fe-2S iron-sulfur cluster-binding protein n=1 Tax=unclassified Oleiphilus TaxID=2631174 RepID=UPI0007C348D1|nr:MULTISPECIES: 2Fe-2S iron-sulfur cluster-binding protein [unclassified Oleiphilus]KZY68226.1 hypothetical protein A3737_02610 [Oleiphilus sp. HI0065]KZY82248.1 hypothetical protein A3742_10325 [Oleiphilus sp. HI0071]KZY93343.1 hypothetical protein A3744_18015 [Oleiphilus sp. HI0073]KZZ42956.1 hypothetical protein A3758_05135 [Oleiphilus sp. HI0118]KZZ53746.1 hypothetical protein A3760_09520 [Oleiphilus sp. HI0122]KZZ77489.1 hypothetical protein A3767_02710 [Oleiphilus sp. HI0133]